MNKTVRIIVGNLLIFEKSQVEGSVLGQLRDRFTRTDPSYFKNKAMGYKVDFSRSQIRSFKEGESKIGFFRGTANILFDLLKSNGYQIEIIDKTSSGKEIVFGIKPNIKLRDYQDRASSEMSKKTQRILLSPTASGKTITAMSIIEKLQKKTLIIIHNSVLFEQWKTELVRCSMGSSIGQHGYGEKEDDCDIVISTVQSLWRMNRKDLAEWSKKFGIVIIDECHKVPAFSTCEVVNNLLCHHRYGLTGTIKRKDGLEFLITDTISNCICEVTTEEVEFGSKERALPPEIETKKIKTIEWDSEIPNWNFILEALLNSDERNEIIANEIKRMATKGHISIVASDRIEHIKKIEDLLKKRGLRVGVIIGEIPIRERDEIKSRTKRGEIEVLIATRSIIAEGVDIPILSCLHLIIPTSNKLIVEQLIGRIKRYHKNKPRPVVIDYVDTGIPMLVNMYNSRKSLYRKNKYEVKDESARLS